MSLVQSIQTISKFQVIDLPLNELYISPTNPRQTFNQDSIAELAADIDKNGLMSPITVRYNPTKSGTYEIVVGSRRSRAYNLLKLETIPCFLKELSDETVMEMQFSENLKREDVHPLEEAEAFQYYLDSKKLTVQDIAGRLNCSPAFVYSRLRLNHLTDSAKTLLRNGKITIRVASHIAKFEENYQEDILRSAVHGQGDGAEVWRTEGSLIQHIKDYFMTRIKDAPFDYQDAAAHNGSCTTCNKNTACNKLLFAEYADDGRCTDRKCWDVKKNEYRTAKIAEAKSTYGDNALFLTYDYFCSRTDEELDVKLENATAYEVVSPYTEGARPALCIDTNQRLYRDETFKPLEIVYVVERQKKNTKIELTQQYWDAYNEKRTILKQQIDNISDDELLQDLQLIQVIQAIENLGSFEYADYYYKKQHKKHPFQPLSKIAVFNDEYDNMSVREVSREEYVKSKVDAYLTEMKTQRHNLSYNDLFRIHVVQFMPEEELESILRQKLIDRVRRMADDYYLIQNTTTTHALH